MKHRTRLIAILTITALLLGLIGLMAVDVAPAQAGSYTFSSASVDSSDTYYGTCQSNGSVPIYGEAFAFTVSTTGTYAFSNPQWSPHFGQYVWASVHTSPTPSPIYDGYAVGMWSNNPGTYGGVQPQQLQAGTLYYAILSGDITGGCTPHYPTTNYSVILSGSGEVMPAYIAGNAAEFNAAISAANSDGVASAIHLTGDFSISTNSTTMTSPIYLYGHNYTINGSGAARVLWVDSGGSLNANDLTATNGYADYGGGLTVGGSGSFVGTNVTFTANRGFDGGGSAITSWGGSVSLINSTIKDNLDASAIYASGGAFSAQGTTFENNSCAYSITDNGGNTATNASGCPGTPATPPGISVSAPGATSIAENSSTTFTVTLTDATPSGNVNIPVSASNGQCSVSTTSLTLNAGTMSGTVTISGVDDNKDDGDVSCTAVLGVATGDASFAGINPDDVAVTVTNINNADVTLSPASPPTSIAEGASTTLGLSLNTIPVGGTVTVALSTNDSSQCTVSPTSMAVAFGSTANFSVAGVDDGVYDTTFACIISANFGGSPEYETAFDGTLPMDITNIHAPTISVTSPATNTMPEAGSITFSVALDYTPTGTVTIPISTTDPGECTVAPISLTLSGATMSGNVTIYGSDDGIVDGSQPCTVNIGNATGAAEYVGVTPSPSSIAMTITDIAVAGITVNPPATNPLNEGGSTTFTFKLNVGPEGNVTVPLEVSDPTECAVSPTSVMTGGTALQTVNVSALTDNVVDGTQNCTVKLLPATGPGGYNGFDANDVTFNIVDADTAGVTETAAPAGTIMESTGTSAKFSLDTVPTATVTATVNNTTADECTVTPASFAITDMSEQMLTINGVNDSTADGTQSCSFSVSFAGSSEYNALSYSATVNVSDVNTAGINVSPAGPVNFSEVSSQAFTFTLDTIPLAPVTIPVSVSSGQCGISGSSVVLNGTNWNTGASVTVAAVSEQVTDGNQACNLVTGAASGGADYNGMDPADVTITILDDDTPGWGGASAFTNFDEGNSATVSFNLNTTPDADVTMEFSVTDTTACTVTSATSHTFSANVAPTPFTVEVTGVIDGVTDGNQTCTLQFSPTTTATGYTALGNPTDMSFTVIDIDSPNLSTSVFTPTSIAEGETGSYTVNLTTEPDADVTLNFGVVDSAVCTISGTATHTFTNTTYGNPFTVSVEAVDNALVDGTRTCEVVTTIVSVATGYSTLTPANESVSVTDNDVPGIIIDLVPDGDEDVFTQKLEIKLQTQPGPGEEVVIDFNNLPPEIVVTPNPYTFTETNWNIPVPIVIVIDPSFNGDINEALGLSVDSNGGDYTGLPDIDLGEINVVIELIPPPPPPSLNDWMAEDDEDRGHAYGMPDNVYGNIYMWQGAWQMAEQGIPEQLVNHGVIFAIDVWILTEDGSVQFEFGGYQEICLLGQGRMIFMDATQSPRTMTEILPVEFKDGYTCGWIPNAGTVVLIEP